MEPSRTNNLENITKGKWQWKSNSDPWSQTEEPKWKSYSLEHNYLIEKAYYDEQKEVALGEYLVYPLEMLQKKKGNPQAQRPIRRMDWVEDEEMNDRSSRYFETELPKTLNKIFGSLEDFVSFFGRRNPEISEFQRQFNEFEQSKDLAVLKKIIPQLISCLENELLSPILRQLQDHSISKLKKTALLSTKKRNENLILLFQKDFSSVEEFYGQILKSYTMNTSLYANLNKYLRNESWTEIDNLLPYIFCLCKAFFNIRSTSSPKESSILLYRGTAFDEAALMSYSMKKSERYFSWYSVTSTTRNAKIAQEFMFRSVNLKEKKSPVMFIIEIPIPADDLKWIDINKYSAIPTEDEVILAPGSVFELVEISTGQDKLTTTIQLRLKGEVQSLAYGGMMMQGALQSHMMTENKAKIMGFEGEELYEALMAINGNLLIEEVEFCLCIFDNKRLKKMFEILVTLREAKTLKYISCSFEQNEEIVKEIKGHDGITKIEIVEANDFYKIICNDQKYWGSLRELDLDFRGNRNLTDEELTHAISQGVESFPQLTHLNINLDCCKQITSEGVTSLAKGLGSLSQLTSLTLDFNYCDRITDNEIVNLACKGLKNLPELTSLTLHFGRSKQITDEGLESLASDGLSHLVKLTSLNLTFFECGQITDKGVKILVNQGLKNLAELTSLRVHFAVCTQITDEGLKIFAANGLRENGYLTSLTLNFAFCHQITDQGLESFAANGLKYLVQLTSLDLTFFGCDNITNKGMKNLACEGLGHLKQLKSLALSFRKSKQITDEALSHLAIYGLKYLEKLTFVNLNFSLCSPISKEGVENLMSEGLQYLHQLNSLTLNLLQCKIRDPEIKNLAEKWLSKEARSVTVSKQVLKMVSNLNKKVEEEPASLVFVRGSSKKDKSLSRQEAFETFKSTSQFEKIFAQYLSENDPEIFSKVCEFTSLVIDFQLFRMIKADEAVDIFTSQVVKSLTQLKSFALHFNRCQQFSDQGMLILAKGLKNLSSLTSLSLHVSDCDQITDEGWSFASEGLAHLPQLECLTLDISCIELTDEGLTLSLLYHFQKNLCKNGFDFSFSIFLSLAKKKPSGFGILEI